MELKLWMILAAIVAVCGVVLIIVELVSYRLGKYWTDGAGELGWLLLVLCVPGGMAGAYLWAWFINDALPNLQHVIQSAP